MEINLSDFHFLRPLWLLLVPFGARAEIMLGLAAPFSGPFEYGGEQWQHGVGWRSRR